MPQMIREQPTLLLMAWHTSLNQSNWLMPTLDNDNVYFSIQVEESSSTRETSVISFLLLRVFFLSPITQEINESIISPKVSKD